MSTFPHYQGPASLPSDYALLSRYAASRPVDNTLSESEDESDDEELEEEIGNGRLSPRRSSFPASMAYGRPIIPAEIPSYGNFAAVPPAVISETTPLLGTATTRVDTIEDNMDGKSMYWEELKTLTQYALPVFGCVCCLRHFSPF